MAAEWGRYLRIPPKLQGVDLGDREVGHADRRMEGTVHETRIPEITLSLICGGRENVR